MLELTLEHSILKKIEDIDIVNISKSEMNMLNKINQHCMVVTEELIDMEEERFKAECEVSAEWFRDFIAFKIQSEKSLKILDEIVNPKNISKLNEYQNCIVNVCLNSSDKLLLTDSSSYFLHNLNSINIITSTMINEKGIKNKFNKYTLPIHEICIPSNIESKGVGEWLGRFLKEQKYIRIHDNYIADEDNIKNFNKYMLKYIEKGADIVIYTVETDTIKKQDIITEFTKEIYSDWNISVFIAKSKKEHHARMIVTDDYTISIERGISVFGSKGKTYQAVVNIDSNDDIEIYRYKGQVVQVI